MRALLACALSALAFFLSLGAAALEWTAHRVVRLAKRVRGPAL